MELIAHPSGLLIRGKGDEGVIGQQKDYKPLLQLNLKEPRILDIGAYIGTFVWFAKKNLKPEWVVSVEPDPESAYVFRKNWGNDPTVSLIEAAVTETGDEKLPLYLGKTYSSCNSLEKYQGRKSIEISTVSFTKLLEKGPSLIKCDIEGGEFGFSWKNLPKCVKTIAMEIHQHRPQWIEDMKALDQDLLDQGFIHIRKPKHQLTFHKLDIGVYDRA